VAWEPGEIKAVAFNGGKPVAAQTKRTAGAPAALKLTAITGPDGLRADGSDVALVDVEAVDAKGNRCPTFQQRVDFVLEGAGTWRGGYNSGKTNSTNNTFLDLEAGINRVAVRATRTSGQITLRARSEGLKPGSISIASTPFPAANGYTAAQSSVPAVKLPKQSFARKLGEPPQPGAGRSATMLGRYTTTFNYSGPSSSIVHLDTNARDGKNAYVDLDAPLPLLPGELVGADWIKTANRDSTYGAVDLIELAVIAGTVVSVAHDDRVPRPEWLIRQFRPASLSITVNGQRMSIFQRRVPREESLTLGANTDDTAVKVANMYLVFINSAGRTE
jgi:beta-galactosidase